MFFLNVLSSIFYLGGSNLSLDQYDNTVRNLFMFACSLASWVFSYHILHAKCNQLDCTYDVYKHIKRLFSTLFIKAFTPYIFCGTFIYSIWFLPSVFDWTCLESEKETWLVWYLSLCGIRKIAVYLKVRQPSIANAAYLHYISHHLCHRILCHSSFKVIFLYLDENGLFFAIINIYWLLSGLIYLYHYFLIQLVEILYLLLVLLKYCCYFF